MEVRSRSIRVRKPDICRGVIQIRYLSCVLQEGDAVGWVLRMLIMKREAMLSVEWRIESDIVVSCDHDFDLIRRLGYPVYGFLELGEAALVREIAGVDEDIALWEGRSGVVGVGDADYARFAVLIIARHSC